ncbi:leukocyte elastase inhibitor [Anabrus simplex]|uniref:leukocyte elastase inhibitor n=1 Tax=Anabrus simplex TaxID=316456 RepID=UPI0035A3C6CF
MLLTRLSVLLCFIAVVTTDHTAVHDMAQSNIAFAKKVYKVLAQGTTCSDMNSLVFSPLAIQAGLAATYTGSGGDTAKELVSGLSLNSKQLGRMPQGFSQALPVILKEPRLRYASGLFADNTVNLLPEFQESTKEMFSTDVQKENFRDHPEAAVNDINQWAEQKAGGSARKLMEDGSVDSATQLLLASAVRYDGVWRDPAVSPATSTKNKTYNLHYSGRMLVGLLPDLKAYVIQIPHQLTPESSKAKGLRLLLIAPIDAPDALIELHKNLDKINFETLDEELFAKDTQLLVTNLDLEYTYSMKEVLQKVGIVNLFDSSANLRGVAEGPLKMNDVLHTASIQMQDERDASTDTDIFEDKNDNIIMALGSYIFILQDPKTKAIVLMGRRGCFD